jgi:hypothetical protein
VRTTRKEIRVKNREPVAPLIVVRKSIVVPFALFRAASLQHRPE